MIAYQLYSQKQFIPYQDSLRLYFQGKDHLNPLNENYADLNVCDIAINQSILCI